MARLDIDADEIEIEIEGKVHRRVLRRSQTYLTFAGEVVVEHTLYKDRTDEDAHCVSPMELSLGVVGNFWTPRAAQQALWVVTQLTPKKSEELFERVGSMTPSKSSTTGFASAPSASSRGRTRWTRMRESARRDISNTSCASQLAAPEDRKSLFGRSTTAPRASHSVDGSRQDPQQARGKEDEKERAIPRIDSFLSFVGLEANTPRLAPFASELIVTGGNLAPTKNRFRDLLQPTIRAALSTVAPTTPPRASATASSSRRSPCRSRRTRSSARRARSRSAA